MGLKHKLNEITDPKEPGMKPGACWLIHLHLFLFCLEGSRETKNQNKRVGEREEGKITAAAWRLYLQSKLKDTFGSLFFSPLTFCCWKSRVLLAAEKGSFRLLFICDKNIITLPSPSLSFLRLLPCKLPPLFSPHPCPMS